MFYSLLMYYLIKRKNLQNYYQSNKTVTDLQKKLVTLL